MIKVKLMREKLDIILRDNESLKLLSNENIDESILTKTLYIDGDTSNNSTLYAWIPKLTLLCPSELGTTSDSCSSHCGVGSCSRRHPDSDPENDNDLPKDRPPQPRSFSGETPISNPF